MATSADILGLNQTRKVPAKWSQHYSRLCEERDRLLDRDFTETETFSAKMDDLGEAASAESERSISLLSASATQDIIFEVLNAIRRIETGSYGICEMNGQPIEPERLKAIPWTRYSLEGQNELEKAGMGRRHALPMLETLTRTSLFDEDESELEAESD